MRLTGAVFIYHKLLTEKKREIRDIYSGGILKEGNGCVIIIFIFPPTPAVGTSMTLVEAHQYWVKKIRMVVA